MSMKQVFTKKSLTELTEAQRKTKSLRALWSLRDRKPASSILYLFAANYVETLNKSASGGQI